MSAAAVEENRRWETHSDILFGALPYLLLLLPTAWSLTHDHRGGGQQPVLLALVAAAGCWSALTYTLPTRRHSRRRYGTAPAALYLAGLLALAAALMAHDRVFMLFAATGFLQALVLLPTCWAFACVAATSFVVNTVPAGLPEPTLTALIPYTGAIAFQTVLIGWINLLSSRLGQQHRDRRHTVAELRTALTENAGLYAQLITQAREAGIHDERRRMAGEIHDTLAQGLAGIIRQLEAAEHTGTGDEDRRHHIRTAKTLARESLREARRSAQALRPEQLESTTLPEALGTLARTWAHGKELHLSFETTGTTAPLHPELEATLYRVAQEALTNTAKHARATQLTLTLSYMDDLVVLDILDNGTGFRPPHPTAPDGTTAASGTNGANGAAEAGSSDEADGTGGASGAVRAEGAAGAGHGLGLIAMRRRLSRVAGTLTIESAPGEGTALSAAVPAIPPGAGT
ncbi:sensor histidine kinase [Streptomyces physcomitrii]|uniref:sensor histidine kinase n=1 Tax=Streptomyces physcomitrii TaxID=2724184 RepID=UPI00342E09E3